MVICSRGCPLRNDTVLRGRLQQLVSTVTLREADKAWVQSLEVGMSIQVI